MSEKDRELKIVELYYMLGGKKGSWLQRKWSEYCNNRIFEKKKKYLHKNGVLILNKFQEACSKCDINGWLEFGTLLGAYREKSFISHDYDLDVGIYADDYTEVFKNMMRQLGFTEEHSFYLFDVEHKLKILSEVTYSYNGFAIDVFLSHKKENHRTVYVFVANGTDRPAVNKYDLDHVSPVRRVYIDNNPFKSPF